MVNDIFKIGDLAVVQPEMEGFAGTGVGRDAISYDIVLRRSSRVCNFIDLSPNAC
jgi:hypothetical protein